MNTCVRAWLVASSLALAAAAGHAADPYPSRVIRIVVPFAAGSGSDNIARTLATRVATATGWQFVVDNKAGANGILGAQEAKRAAPDGYTLFYTGNSTHGANSALYKALPYDPVADFDPITRVGVFPLVLLTRPDLGASSVAQLTAMAKAKPDGLTYAAGSAGPRVAAENYKAAAGVEVRYIPYKASPQALTDLAAGHVDTMFLDSVSSIPMVKGGKVRGLAVTSQKRLDQLPDMPTMAELGFKDFEVLNWSAVFVPHGTPQPVRDALYKAFADVVASDEWKRYVGELGGYADAQTPAQTAAFVQREIRGYKETLGRAGVVPE